MDWPFAGRGTKWGCRQSAFSSFFPFPFTLFLFLHFKPAKVVLLVIIHIIFFLFFFPHFPFLSLSSLSAFSEHLVFGCGRLVVLPPFFSSFSFAPFEVTDGLHKNIKPLFILHCP